LVNAIASAFCQACIYSISDKQDIICYETYAKFSIMTNPVLHAFFVGKALAEVAYEKTEDTLSNALSELGKFDAEQRENLRHFTAEVLARAEQEMARQTSQGTTAPGTTTATTPRDTQEIIDELRAQIAQVRADLTVYRAQRPAS
jgi:uncharacterized coiled-coil protein SlyX